MVKLLLKGTEGISKGKITPNKEYKEYFFIYILIIMFSKCNFSYTKVVITFLAFVIVSTIFGVNNIQNTVYGTNLVNSSYSRHFEDSTNQSVPKELQFLKSCSVFTVETNETVLFGNNEDEGGPRLYTRIWFEPSTSNYTYGCAFLGFNDNPFPGNDVDGLAIGGINSEGLCFDANGVGLTQVPYDYTKGSARSAIRYWGSILSECASVMDVINWYETHNNGGWWGNQLHFADSTGAAVVVSALDTGVAYTLKNSSYFVSTNFNLADYSNGYYPCQRYNTVSFFLDYYDSRNSVTIESARGILRRVHSPGTDDYIGTAYTNIFDLKTKLIYINVHGDYENTVLLDLEEELAKGYHEYTMGYLEENIEQFTSLDKTTSSTSINFSADLLLCGIIIYGVRKMKMKR